MVQEGVILKREILRRALWRLKGQALIRKKVEAGLLFFPNLPIRQEKAYNKQKRDWMGERNMVGDGGLEPPAFGSGDQRSIHLS